MLLESLADRLVEPGLVPGRLPLALLEDERIAFLRQLKNLLANLLALFDLVRNDLVAIIGRELLEFVGKLVLLQGVEFDPPVLDGLDQVTIVVSCGVDRLIDRTVGLGNLRSATCDVPLGFFLGWQK